MFGFLRHGENSLSSVFCLGRLGLTNTALGAALGSVCSAAACAEVNSLRKHGDLVQVTHRCKQELISPKSKQTVKGLLFLKEGLGVVSSPKAAACPEGSSPGDLWSHNHPSPRFQQSGDSPDRLCLGSSAQTPSS